MHLADARNGAAFKRFYLRRFVVVRDDSPWCRSLILGDRMIEGSCHCGAVRWKFDGLLASATACNCTICRRYGVLWAYDHEGEKIQVSGPTSTYECGERTLAFHFCPDCGCVAYWRSLTAGEDGRRRIAVNLRLAEPEAVGAIAIQHLDGLDSWKNLVRDTRCVTDLWF